MDKSVGRRKRWRAERRSPVGHVYSLHHARAVEMRARGCDDQCMRKLRHLRPSIALALMLCASAMQEAEARGWRGGSGELASGWYIFLFATGALALVVLWRHYAAKMLIALIVVIVLGLASDIYRTW